MNIADFQQEAVQNKLNEEGLTIAEITPEVGRGPFIAANGLVAIPVFQVHRYSPKNDVYEIPVKFDSQDIGSLCLMSMIKPGAGVLSSLTDNQYTAYLALISSAGFLNGDFPSFSQDCIVIRQEDIGKYWLNKDSSALWGGFVQIEGARQIPDGEIPTSTANITIKEGCKARTASRLLKYPAAKSTPDGRDALSA
jgi:hypothetical protein